MADPWQSQPWFHRTKPITPNMRLYLQTQMDDLSTILFMRLGKFYECFGPHVETVEHVLELQPAEKMSRMFGMPNNGIPYVRFESALAKLQENGHRVRVIEPLERPPPRKRSRL